jgi:hypothetical protein
MKWQVALVFFFLANSIRRHRVWGRPGQAPTGWTAQPLSEQGPVNTSIVFSDTTWSKSLSVAGPGAAMSAMLAPCVHGSSSDS